MESVGLRILYLRELMESIHRRERAAAQRLALRLPERLRPHIAYERLQPRTVGAVLPLDEAEELLLAIDEAIGEGSGRVLDEASYELALRGLLRGTLGALVGDGLADTLTRLGAALERWFDGVVLLYEVDPNDTGVEIAVGIAGRPRAARVLRHLTSGMVRAAHEFVREGDPTGLRIIGEVIGDRARLSIRYRTPSVVTAMNDLKRDPSAPPSRRPTRDLRQSAGSLTAEVDRIMVSTRRSVPPPGRARRASVSEMPSVRSPSVPSVEIVSKPSRGSGSMVAVRTARTPSEILPSPRRIAESEPEPAAEAESCEPVPPSRPSSIPPPRR
ncbi:MAG: hypothetical protein JW751_19745 [Polyangiaceae bacterium]|nr:hypothetical protein [Polyangiaceae bacterium]